MISKTFIVLTFAVIASFILVQDLLCLSSTSFAAANCLGLSRSRLFCAALRVRSFAQFLSFSALISAFYLRSQIFWKTKPLKASFFLNYSWDHRVTIWASFPKILMSYGCSECLYLSKCYQSMIDNPKTK